METLSWMLKVTASLSVIDSQIPASKPVSFLVPLPCCLRQAPGHHRKQSQKKQLGEKGSQGLKHSVSVIWSHVFKSV